MTKKLYAIILNNKIVGDLIHGGRAIYESESEAKEKLNFISTYAIEYFSNQGIEPYPKSSYSIKEYILKEDKKKIQNKKKLDIMGNLFAKLSNSKIPDKYIIKLYTKKELYQKMQQYIQTICQLKQQLAEKQNTINEINKEFVQAVHDWKALCAEKDKEINELNKTLEMCKHIKRYD